MAVIKQSDTDGAVPLLALRCQPPGITADEAFVDPFLGLVAQIVVDARDHDDQSVARIRRLANQAGVVRRLAALDVADNHPPAIPFLIESRIAQATEDAVSQFVSGGDDVLWQAVLVQQLFVTVPVERVDGRLGLVQPGAKALVIDHRPEPHGDAETLLNVTCELLEGIRPGIHVQRPVHRSYERPQFAAAFALMCQ